MTRTPTIAKHLARQRMASTGESFTAALRVVRAEYRQARVAAETSGDQQAESGESQHE